MTITLLSKELVECEAQFYYLGPMDECSECKFNGICNNLEEGTRYRVVDVRKQEHDCPSLENEKVVAVEVEKIAAPAILPKKGLLEGVTVTFSEMRCDNPGCPNWWLCHPIGKKDGCKCTVVSMGKNVECPRGEKLAFVEIV